MSENATVVPVPEETSVPKTPFYKNRRILKNAAIVASSVAATALVITRFRKNDSEDQDSSDDSTDIVID